MADELVTEFDTPNSTIDLTIQQLDHGNNSESQVVSNKENKTIQKKQTPTVQKKKRKTS